MLRLVCGVCNLSDRQLRDINFIDSLDNWLYCGMYTCLQNNLDIEKAIDDTIIAHMNTRHPILNRLLISFYVTFFCLQRNSLYLIPWLAGEAICLVFSCAGGILQIGQLLLTHQNLLHGIGYVIIILFMTGEIILQN